MCKSPISIKNPLYNRASYCSERGSILEMPRYFASKNEYISVKCGKCQECRDSYYNSILQRGIVESLSSYVYFVTLTYDNKHIPSLILPNGKRIYYTNYSDVQLMFKRLRNKNIIGRQFRYLSVNEYGDNYHRPHVHLLIFVASQANDDETTPYFIERLLFDNLIKYFAVNKGTRKVPLYEQLLTYRVRVQEGKMRSNYFVKYVEPTYTNKKLFTEDVSIVKSIRYTLSYVNKGGSFDKVVNDYINTCTDEVIKRKLKTILSTRLRFSKGFGLGFIDGHKYDCPPVFKKASLVKLYQSDYSLPNTFAEFVDLYPYLYVIIKTIIDEDQFSQLSRIEDIYYCEDHLIVVRAIMKYFPHYFSLMYARCFKSVPLNDCISYFFTISKEYKYNFSSVKTYEITNVPVFRYIRDGIHLGFTHRVPYLTFSLVSDCGFNALCDFYKQRFTTLDDYIFLYENIGVNNFDEYVASFRDSIVSYRDSKAIGNNVIRDVEMLQPTSNGVKPPNYVYDLL